MEKFQQIGLIGKQGDPEVQDTLQRVGQFLSEQGRRVLLDEASTATLDVPGFLPQTLPQIARTSDLAIVIGGDGSLLRAARALAPYGVPLLGINLGRLGFLADISPSEMLHYLEQILAGDYEEEKRCLLRAEIKGREAASSGAYQTALNDVVVHKWHSARMIEFETHINGTFVNAQRSDGLIVATPTGSTAYALSGGGPLIHPALDAVVLVPICPHTLSNRPIVVDSNSRIEIRIFGEVEHVRMTSDGQTNQPLSDGESIFIERDPHSVRLIHPQDHDHYQILRAKLGWGDHPSLR